MSEIGRAATAAAVRWPGSWWRTSPASSPGPYATMLLADMGAEVVKVEGPRGDDTRTWMPPVARRRLDLLPGHQPRQALDRARPARRRRRRGWPASSPAAPTSLIENFKPGGLATYGLDYDAVRGDQPRASSTPRSAGSAPAAGAHVPGYDLMVQAISGLMSLTGDPDGPPYRAGISVFDVMAGNHALIGILAALRHRDATGEGQHVEVNLLSSALTGPGQPQLGVRRRATSCPTGWATRTRACSRTSRCPPRTTTSSSPPANDGQFRKLCEVLGIPELADDPRFARNADRTAQPRGAAPAARRAAGARAGAVEWFDAARRRRRAVRTDQHRSTAGSPWPSGSGSTRSSQVGEGDRAVPTTRHPIRFSATPAGYRLPPPELDEHGDGAAQVARDAGGRRGDAQLPHRPRRLVRPETITLLGHDLAEDVMGKVGFGELAFWLATQRRPTPGETRVFEAVLAALADHGFTPTAIVTRLTYLSAPDSVQGALAAGLLGGGSRFLGVTEDCGRFLHDVLGGVDGALPTDDAGWDALALATVQPQRAAGRFVPGLGHHVHKEGDPRTPRLMRIAARGGPVRAAPAAVRRDRPGAPAGARPDAAAQRRRRLRRRAGRPRAAAGAAARVRAAGPHRRADRAARRGAAPPRRRTTSSCRST